MLAAILVAASLVADPGDAMAQVGQLGQMGMAPVSGVVNRAVGGFQNLNASGPGWLYYGVNAADRGLGYRGSYLTLGGFIPYAEDDLGGFWSADLRSHLSNYGGLFSNVGIVRKQFVGGALAGFGLYWDYDGDQNQYSPAGRFRDIPGEPFRHRPPRFVPGDPRPARAPCRDVGLAVAPRHHRDDGDRPLRGRGAVDRQRRGATGARVAVGSTGRRRS